MAEINSRSQEYTIGTTVTEVSGDKSGSPGKRVRLILVNKSTGGQTFNIGINQEATSTLGIPLYPGGSIEWIQDVLPITQARVTAIASGAAATLSVYEEVLT